MMESEKVDLIMDICLSFYNDIDIYGKKFEKLEIDRPYAEIIKMGFDTILNGKGADAFETIIESEILWFIKTNANVNKQIIFELSFFKKFWMVSEKEGRVALYEFVSLTISPKLFAKYEKLLDFLKDEKDVMKNIKNETTFSVKYLDE